MTGPAQTDCVSAVLAPDGNVHAVYRPHGSRQGTVVCPALYEDVLPDLPVVPTVFTDCPVCADFVDTCRRGGDVLFLEPQRDLLGGIASGLVVTFLLAVCIWWTWTLYTL